MAQFLRHHSVFGIIRKCNLLVQSSRVKKQWIHSTAALDKLVRFNLSDIGEGIHEVTVKEWFVKEGDSVEQFDNICEVQSDKASVTITSRFDGKILKIHHNVDEIALVGKPLVDFDVEENDSDSSDDEAPSKTEAAPESTIEKIPERRKVLTAPSVRRIAKENSLDLLQVIGTGKQGRILKEDILKHLNLIPGGDNTKAPPTTIVVNGIEPKEEPEFVPVETSRTVASPLEYRTEVLKGVRKGMYKSMTESLKIPHFTYSEEVDMTKLVAVREDVKEESLKRGVKMTYMPFFIKAVSTALHKYPILNSSFDEKTESVIYKPYHNISVAIHTSQGLVVPNVKHVHMKSIIDIAKDLNLLQERGAKGTLTLEDFAHGTFSLSNIGVIGGTYTHPVIMSPQVAIGAIGKTKVVPRFGPDGEIVKAHIMNVSFSADHRVIDGVTMASFCNLWKEYLENPNLFLLDAH